MHTECKLDLEMWHEYTVPARKMVLSSRIQVDEKRKGNMICRTYADPGDVIMRRRRVRSSWGGDIDYEWEYQTVEAYKEWLNNPF